MVLKIVSDVKDAQKGLDDVKKKGSETGSALGTASLAAAGGLAVLGAFALSSASAAADDAQAQAVLATSLRNAAGATDKQVASTEAWITKTTLATGVADSQLRPALGTLVRATGDVQASQDALTVAMDVSAATGKDLGAVTDAMAKGYAGNTGALGKLIPGMDQAVLKSGDMNAIMSELARTTGGTLAAANDTAAGTTEIMKNKMAEAQETIGAAFLPVLASLIGMLASVANWVSQNTTVVIVLMGVLAALAAAVITANVVMAIQAGLQAESAAAVAGNTIAMIAYAAQTVISTAATVAWNAITAIARAGMAAYTAVMEANIGTMIVAAARTVATTAATLAYNAVMLIVRGATLAWTAAQWLLNAAIYANPIGLIVLAIVALIAGIILAYQKCDAFRNVVDAMGRAFMTAARAIMDAIGWIIDKLQALWDMANKVRDAVKGALSHIPGLGGLAPKATVSVIGPARFGGASPVAVASAGGFGASQSGTVTPVNITVQTTGLGASAPQIQDAIVGALRKWSSRNGALVDRTGTAASRFYGGVREA